jgi:hypothetical protein
VCTICLEHDDNKPVHAESSQYPLLENFPFRAFVEVSEKGLKNSWKSFFPFLSSHQDTRVKIVRQVFSTARVSSTREKIITTLEKIIPQLQQQQKTKEKKIIGK